MSYILDALKKSESERQNQDLPNINAVHQRPELHPQRKRRIWLLAIPAALILNIVGFWFLWDRSPSEDPKSITPVSISSARTSSLDAVTSTPEVQQIDTSMTIKIQPPETSPAGRIIPEANLGSSDETAELLITPTDAYQKTASNSIAAERQQGEKYETSASQPVNKITALPTNIQRQIPDLKFSSHLYADDSSFRMVNINGNMFHEGDIIAEGIQLERISEEGVVLNYLHYTFEISVIRDWSFQ